MADKEVAEVLLSDGNGLLSANVLVEHLKAVCLIQATVTGANQKPRLRRGTGFYTVIVIDGNDYHGIITNNHVLSQPQDAEMAEAVFGYDVKQQGKKVTLKPHVVFKTNQELDYSFVGVKKEDIDALDLGISPIKFRSEPETIDEGDDIFILQHPKGRPKEFSHDKIISVEPPFVYYKADTESGSSGAPVFWRLNLIAVHQNGSEELGYNKGVLCSEVLSHLNTGKYTTPKISPLSNSQGKEIDEEIQPVKKPKLDNDVISPSEDELQDLAQHITVIWKHLGRTLGVSNSKIEEISRDHINYQGIREKAFQTLLFWKESNTNCTYKCLGEALKKLGKSNIAQKYCNM